MNFKKTVFLSSYLVYDKVSVLPEGIYDSHNMAVTPSSLYLAQLQERLGKQAVLNIGYKITSNNLYIKNDGNKTIK